MPGAETCALSQTGSMSPERQAWDLENAIVHSAAHAAREMVTACVPTSGAGLNAYVKWHQEFESRFGYQLRKWKTNCRSCC